MIAVSQVHLHELFGGLLTAVDERCDTRFLRHAEELRDAVIEKPPAEVVDGEFSRIEHLVRAEAQKDALCALLFRTHDDAPHAELFQKHQNEDARLEVLSDRHDDAVNVVELELL